MRPNIAQDAPPTHIEVEGVSYPINTDFRIWVDVLNDLRHLVTTPETLDHITHNAEIMKNAEIAVFGRLIPHPAANVLSAMMDFAQGYPEAPVQSGKSSHVQTYSFNWDLNYIVIAIMNQFGIDLTWRRTESFHWWEFLTYFRALSGNHYILRLMEIRGYDGKDDDLKRQAAQFALPREETEEDRAILDRFDELFYNA